MKSFVPSRKGLHRSLYFSKDHGDRFARVRSQLPKSRRKRHTYRKRRRTYRTRARGPSKVKRV